jgi:hypothetical protein
MEPELDAMNASVILKDHDECTVVQKPFPMLQRQLQELPHVHDSVHGNVLDQLHELHHEEFWKGGFTTEADDQIEHVEPV